MASIREKMAASTANLRSASEITADEIPRKTRPKTAPGMMGALAAAETRIKELESRGDSSSISMKAISPNPWQPRKKFDPEYIASLASSIGEIGLIQPILLRVDPKDAARYQIVVGEMRYRAHELLEMSEIKAFVVELDDAEMAIWALTENVTREDLSDYEISQAIRETMTQFPSKKALAESLGMSRTQLYRFLSFEKLPQFVLDDLTIKPSLLGSSASQELQTVLKEMGESGITALQEVWPAVVEGKLEQTKLASAMKAVATRQMRRPSITKNVTSLFQKGKVAGHIKKDASFFMVKIKANLITEDKEERIRKILEELYTTD